MRWARQAQRPALAAVRMARGCQAHPLALPLPATCTLSGEDIRRLAGAAGRPVQGQTPSAGRREANRSRATPQRKPETLSSVAWRCFAKPPALVVQGQTPSANLKPYLVSPGAVSRSGAGAARARCVRRLPRPAGGAARRAVHEQTRSLLLCRAAATVGSFALAQAHRVRCIRRLPRPVGGNGRREGEPFKGKPQRQT